jgi:hypothetical protein
MQDKETSLEQLTVFIHPERKQALRIECAKRNITMKEAIENFIDELSGTKKAKKAA